MAGSPRSRRRRLPGPIRSAHTPVEGSRWRPGPTQTGDGEKVWGGTMKINVLVVTARGGRISPYNAKRRRLAPTLAL